MTTKKNVIKFNTLPKLDKNKIIEKRKILQEVSKQLKSEFFGLDAVIDKVVNSIQAWYIFPEIISRPVIINLWGMTGVGKTQLVRRLASLLQFSDRFVEVQMDGGSISSTWTSTSLTNILSSSQIEEGIPGILLLDEIQRFRTVDESGGDVKVERFQDVWTLLSDGKFSADASMFSDIEMMIAYQNFYKDEKLNSDDDEPEDEGETKPPKSLKKRAYQIYPYEAKNLKKVLRLPQSIAEIMAWDTSKITEVLSTLKANRTTWEIDYTKLLIFVSGNLDKAFIGSNFTDDCDTDADFYHEQTKKITSTEIKKHLRGRFRPEQISRLGNNHVIYPSMSKASYEKLIDATCQKYLDEMEELSGIHFSLHDNVKHEIYNNSVYPTQGTRPVFSSIHMIFSSVLVNVTFWCVENNHNTVSLAMSPDLKTIVATAKDHVQEFDVDLELNAKKAKTSLDVKTMIAVHEAGHAYVFAKLTKAAPLEVKINAASFTGGYMLPTEDNLVNTRQHLRDSICIYLAGTAAEEIIFGANRRSDGAAGDLLNATNIASWLYKTLWTWQSAWLY
jgi:regulator of sigma D